MLPDDFGFSQSSLQDFVDCQRRFQLKYIERRVWPAVEVEPFLEREELTAKGQRFHRMLERFYAGISADVVASTIQDDEIRQWWQAFCDDPPLNLPQGLLLPEYRMAAMV